MTWTSRIRLLAGMLVVLVIAALATYQLNETRGVAVSDSAQILAKSYGVGTPYSGLVVDQLVDVGDAVTTGEQLFVIDSATLQYDVKNGFAAHRDGGDADRRRGPARRPRHGRRRRDRDRLRARHVRPVGRAAGDRAAGGHACTCRPSTRSPRRSTHGWRTTPPSTVVLPNQRTITVHVSEVQVETVAGSAQAVLTLTGTALKDGAQNGLVSAGTPVTAELQLDNDGVVTRTAASVKTYLGGLFR